MQTIQAGDKVKHNKATICPTGNVARHGSIRLPDGTLGLPA